MRLKFECEYIKTANVLIICLDLTMKIYSLDGQKLMSCSVHM